MDLEISNAFPVLDELANDYIKGPSECYRILKILNYNLTEEQLNASLVDLYFVYTFDKNNGIFTFLFKVSSNSKFDNASLEALDIVYTLINNFPNKAEQHILDVNENTLKLLKGKNSARLKCKLLSIFLISFEKVDVCLEKQTEYMAIFSGLRDILLQGNHSDSVKSKEFEAVGLFIKKFSYLISDSKSLTYYFTDQLNIQMFQKSQMILCGIFTGLSYISDAFPFDLEDELDFGKVKKIYEHIKTLSNPPKEAHRQGSRAAISYLGKHMIFFNQFVCTEYKFWHKILLKDWLEMGADDRKAAEKTLALLLFTISSVVNESNDDKLQDVLKHFVKWFKFVLKSKNSSDIEKKLCIDGLKYFAGAIYKKYAKEDARAVFLLIMQHFEKLYILEGDDASNALEFLPNYVQCIASFMRYQSISSTDIYCLQRAVINMVKTFHKLKPVHHHKAVNALVTTLYYLTSTKYFDSFLENVIYQGVLWSCSHQHIVNAEFSDEENTIVTVKDYFPLWRGLLKHVPSSSHYSANLEDPRYVLRRVVNELMKVLLILINKLNINVKLKEEAIQTDIETTYELEHRNDFAIFLNLIDFYQNIFEEIDPELLKTRICKVINHLVTKCVKYSIVSGLYKLLSFSLSVSNKLELFNAGNLNLNQDIVNCRETLSSFLKHLLHKMKQFKDELLVSCLKVLLESPISIVELMLPQCVDIFITVFLIGRNYIALADMGINALEKWQQFMDKDQFETFAAQVVPYLDSYLKSKSLGRLTQEHISEKKRKTARMLKKRSILLELEPELVKFQKRVLHFMGNQSNAVCNAFVSPDNNFERKIISENLHLKIELYYNDLQLEFYLEPFLLRVTELSLNSSDRKTRVLACELLQAFVVVFLGKTNKMPRSKLDDLEDLFKNLTGSLLQLACDTDPAVKQIFEPLLMQMIHWYTAKMQRGSPHLAVIIEVLMEGITHSTNSALRDFSGKCINEFVKWTIKQTTEEELKSDPINIKVLVKRIKFYSGYPDLVKKLGAALIFNNIYKEFREEKSLVSMFSLELLHIFVSSLDLLEYCNEETDNVVLYIKNSIKHLQRILTEKCEVFRKPSAIRVVPSGFLEGNLENMLKWLLSMTASRSRYCRDISMDLFIQLQPLSGTNQSISEFATTSFVNVATLYSKRLNEHPTLDRIQCHDKNVGILKWLQNFLCFIDGYIFIIKNSLCPLDFNRDVMRLITYFLEHVHRLDMEQSLQLVCKEMTPPVATAQDKEQFSNLKCACSLSILKLASVLLRNEMFYSASQQFWNGHFWHLVVTFVFKSTTLGFNDVQLLKLLLNQIAQKIRLEDLKDLFAMLNAYLKSGFKVDIDFKRNVCQKDRDAIKGLLLIQSTQLNVTFNAEVYAKGLLDKLMTTFLLKVEDNVIYLSKMSEITSEYCINIFNFALPVTEEFDILLSHLYTDIVVHYEDDTQLNNQASFGSYLITQFADPIIKFIIRDFDKFLNKSDNLEMVIRLSNCVLKYLNNNRKFYSSHFSRIYENIMAKWSVFEMCFEENTDLGLEFSRQIWKISSPYMDSNNNMQKWILSLLNRDELLYSELSGVNLYLNIFNVAAEICDDDTEGLSDALEVFKTKLQPFVQETWVINNLVQVIPTTKIVSIFTFLLNFYLENSSNSQGINGLLKSFLLQISVEQQRKVLEIIYDLSMDRTKSIKERHQLVNMVLPIIFKYSSIAAFESFFEDNIETITEQLESAKNYTDGIVQFLLIEILFLRLPIGTGEDESRHLITEKFDLRKKVLGLALDSFRSKIVEGNFTEIRLYKCAAYKALASIITNCIKSEEFYEKLFIRDSNGEDVLWSSVIDPYIVYNFPIDFDSDPKERKILINIRNDLRSCNNENSSNNSLQYIESQRLYNSSLSEDVSKFDFTNSILRSKPELNKSNGEMVQENRIKGAQMESEISLESTEINNHELMSVVCGIIQHMVRSGMCQLSEDPEEMIELPKWMNGIRNLLLNSKTSKNVKIFWVAVIHNMNCVFQYFARYFAKPLLQFVIDKIAGIDNYFVTDIVVTLALWAPFINSTESQLVSNVLDILISYLKNERRERFKYNLELIKIFVENWKDSISISYNGLYTKLNVDKNDKQIEAGIQLAAIFLANKLLPCATEDLKSFFDKLLDILHSTVSTNYKPCSETLGLLLKYCKSKDMEVSSFKMVLNKTILAFCDKDINKYAHCLEGVVMHYPDIVDDFHIIRMLSRLPQANPNLQSIFLKIISSRVECLNTINSFKTEDWNKYVESQSIEVQLITLNLILQTVSILKEAPTFKTLMTSVSKNLFNLNTLCRGRMYDICIAVSKQSDEIDKDVLELCRHVLIEGLVDSDNEIREQVKSYWAKNPSVPIEITNRFPFLLSHFYLTKTENNFLGYVSYFLLESLEEEYSENCLFENALEDCVFEEYKVDTDWREQHPSVVPMFAETLKTYSEGERSEIISSEFGNLRATQENSSFEPTLQSLRDSQVSRIASFESSLVSTSFASSASDNNQFINPNNVPLSSSYKLLRRRFLKSKSKISEGFAQLAVTKNIQKAVKRYDAVKKSERKINIYRKYRKGDFPDIQINLSSLVKPLQMLVYFDGELSKTFFTQMYRMLRDKVKGTKEDFLKRVSSGIEEIFTKSTQYNANVFSTLFDILLTSSKDFQVDADLISSVSQQSGLISVGTLLLEEYLAHIDYGPSSSKKGSSSSESLETIYWLKLAELYKQLHEWKIVQDIFLNKCNCKEEIRDAIQLESEKRWRDAQHKYESLLTLDSAMETRDFYYESYFKCLGHLGKWDKVPQEVVKILPDSEVPAWEALWDNGWFQHKILPWYVTAEVKNVLFSNEGSQQFFMDINKSLCDPEQNDYLKSNFSEELSILWLTQKNYPQAAQCLKQSVDNFLNEWQLLNPMFGSLRYKKILNFRNLIEISRFLATEESVKVSSIDELKLKNLQDYWKMTQNETLDSIVSSEAKLLYRKLFNKLLVKKLTDFDRLDLVKELKTTGILLDISFMNLAVEEQNFDLTRKYFKNYVDMKHPSLTMIHGNLSYLYSTLVGNNLDVKFEKLLEALKKFREVAELNKEGKVIVSLLKIFDIIQSITALSKDNRNLEIKYKSQVEEIFGSETDLMLSVYCKLKTEALKDCLKTQEDLLKSRKSALLKLAHYVQNAPDRDYDFTLFVLRGMKLESREARQLFPCILLRNSLADELKQLFLSETAAIPTWMFLGWIPQLLANVNSPRVKAISEIILRIAKTYPQSIMYAYRLSKEKYANTENECNEESSRLIDQLDQLLISDPLVDKFLTALSKVSLPSVTLEYYVKRMAKKDAKTLTCIKTQILENLFTEGHDSSNSSSMQGNMYKSIEKLRKQIEDIDQSQKNINNLIQAITKISGDQKASRQLLKDYCPWLANFSATRYNIDLELPGQYTGEKLPLVQYHVKICGFRDTVDIMSSLRRPIKITILGMDSKEYSYLVKFGEDVRQDQRIQQLFGLMNNLLTSENLNHRVLTYQIVPLTTSLGIIQWINHTVSLDSFIEKSISKKKYTEYKELIFSEYQRILRGHPKNPKLYAEAAVKLDKNKVIAFYKSLVNQLPMDVLKQSIWSISLTTENFIAIKDNLIKSYATICACHWLLGIGDRHLDNFKICTRNGKVLGIDFGHAFGTATQFLPIPEILPFRLTPHIVELMQPLGETGLFRDVMIDCLSCLRKNKHTLLATMNVFIEDPSVDWLERIATSDLSNKTKWGPSEKIDQAKRKLSGTSSVTILLEDLQNSAQFKERPDYLEAYCALVKGNENDNLRTRLLSKGNLSVEDQVDSLIDHSTDSNLLGRMFVGWYSPV